MPRTPQDVTEKELLILRLLWDQGPATIRQLTDQMYPERSAETGERYTACYAAVQKFLERLEAKQYVNRVRQAGAHLFEAAIDRDDLIGRRLEEMARDLCDGSLTPLLTHLVRTQRLSPGERDELRQLIDALDRDAKKSGPRR